jgi:magnesium transporter
MQIKYVNRALQRFDATQVIPTQFVLFTLSVILGSAVLYRDFKRTSGEDAGKFIGGCALTFVGVWLITSARDAPSDDDEEFDDEDEEAIILRSGEPYQDDIHANGSQTSIRQSVAGSHHVSARTSLHENHSRVSLPESLERNHWDRTTQSSSTTPRRPSGSIYDASQSQSLEGSLEGNPWQTVSQTGGVKPKASFSRLFNPFKSLLPYHTAEAQTFRAARNSTSDLPSDFHSTTTTTPQTPSTTYQDEHIRPNILGTSLPTHPEHPPSDRHTHLLPRSSLSSLYPAPYTSPLSASLSAVVADSIRRRMRLRPRRPGGRPHLASLPADPSHPQRVRGNSEPASAEAAQAAVLEHALREEINRRTPSKRRYGHDGAGDGAGADDDDEEEAGSEDDTPRRKSLGSRLGGLFRSTRARLSVSRRHSDEPAASEEQV